MDEWCAMQQKNIDAAARQALVGTNGLPRLLNALQPESSRKSSAGSGETSNGYGGSIGIIVLLHIMAIVLLIIGTSLTVDAATFRTNALLVNAELAPPFVSVLITNLIIYIAFALLSGIDASFYLCTNATITGAALGLGLATVGLSGSVSVVMALQGSDTAAFVWLGAFLSTCLVFCMQLAMMLSILVKSNSPLLRAIRESV